MDVGRRRSAPAVAHDGIDRLGRTLQHDLDAAVVAVGGPSGDPFVPRRLPGRVAIENSLHLPVNHEPPADRLRAHLGHCRSAAVPSAGRAMLDDSLMNALWLALGVIIGAGILAVALRPRLRALSVEAARARDLEGRLVKANADLEHERERAAERLATVSDAQERLSASFKALSAEALQSSMSQLAE